MRSAFPRHYPRQTTFLRIVTILWRASDRHCGIERGGRHILATGPISL